MLGHVGKAGAALWPSHPSNPGPPAPGEHCWGKTRVSTAAENCLQLHAESQSRQKQHFMGNPSSSPLPGVLCGQLVPWRHTVSSSAWIAAGISLPLAERCDLLSCNPSSSLLQRTLGKPTGLGDGPCFPFILPTTSHTTIPTPVRSILLLSPPS